MINENETLPDINNIIRKASPTSSKLNSSYINNNNINASSDCDSIISYKDEKSPEKKALFDKIYKTKHGDSRSILSIAKDLNSNIQSLDGKISKILGKHHKDYVATFNEFMMAVKKDLREKIDSLEVIDNEKKKSDDSENLKVERNFFREEAIRLNNICLELTKNNEDLLRENKFKNSEIKQLMKKWKESEETNRQLLQELERNLKNYKNLEANKKQLQSKQNNINFKNSNDLLSTNKTDSKSLYKTVFDSKDLNNNLYEINNFNNNFNNNNSDINEYKQKLNLFKSSSLSNIFSKFNNNNNPYSNANLNNSGSFNMHNNSTEDLDLTANNNYNLNNSNNNLNLINYGSDNNFISKIPKKSSDTVNNYDSNNNNNNNINYNIEKEKIINLIEKLKAELKREKSKNSKLVAEFNIILLEKKKLEKIFMDCVEETRKEILQRKSKENINSTKSAFFSSFAAKGKSTNFTLLPSISDIKYENFQLNDKKKLLETFIMKDEVINFIRENLSSINPDSNASYLNNYASTQNIIKNNNNNSNRASCYNKNAMSESVFTFRQTMLKSEVAKFGFDDFAKSKNSLYSLKSSSQNLNFLK